MKTREDQLLTSVAIDLELGSALPGLMKVVALALIVVLVPTESRGAGSAATSPMQIARDMHTATLLNDGRVLVVGGNQSTSTALASTEIYDPGTGSWSLSASLGTGRFGHTATLLPDGRVLVAGGSDQGTEIASAEIFGPATGSFQTTGSMSVARGNQTATLLEDGTVLLAGGFSGGYATTTAEIYNPASGSFGSAGSLNRKRASHTATLLSNGFVLVAGGVDPPATYLVECELYDPASRTFAPTASMPRGRQRHIATLLRNGRVAVAGGDLSDLATDLYDVASGTWTAGPNLTTKRVQTPANLLPDGRLIVIGGGINGTNSTEIYDPAGNSWSAGPTMTAVRTVSTSTLLADGRILVAGGANSTSALKSAELITFASPSWSGTGNMASARERATATILPSGKILLAGGLASAPLASSELYDPATASFAATGGMATARSGHTATLLVSGSVIMVGGRGATNQLSSTESYLPGAGGYQPGPSLATPRGYHSATLLDNGDLLIAGGNDGAQSLDSSELLSSQTGTFSSVGVMSVRRDSHTATLLPNGRVLIAGGKLGSSPLFGAELYNPASKSYGTTGLLNGSRYDHSATLLRNGKILIAGGRTAATSSIATCEIYDPSSGSFTNTGSLIVPRHGHLATLLDDGRVLIAGGSFGTLSLASAEIYDPVTGICTSAGSMTSRREAHTMVPLETGDILVAGGYSSTSGSPLNSADLFTPGLGYLESWRPTLVAAPAALPDGGVLSLSGSGFTPSIEAGGGTMQQSTTNIPAIRLRRLDNGMERWLLPGASFDDAGFTSRPVSGLAQGLWYATVMVNGIPSHSKAVSVGSVVRDYLVGEGLGSSNSNRVRVFTSAGAATTVDFQAYGAGKWGTNVASGSFTTTSEGEILTGAGPGAVYGPHVRLFDRTGNPVSAISFYAYGTLKYGVNTAGGNVDTSSFSEILTGAGPGAVFGPHVRGWRASGGHPASIPGINFFAYGTLKYGVNAERGDVDRDGFDEIATGPGPGVIFGPQVRGWNYDGANLRAISGINFNAFGTPNYGVNLDCGDVDADGYAEIVATPGPGQGSGFPSRFKGFDYDGAPIAGLPGYDVTAFGTSYGGRVGIGDLDLDGSADLVAGAGRDPAADSTVKTYGYSGSTLSLWPNPFLPFAGSAYGVNVSTGALNY